MADRPRWPRGTSGGGHDGYLVLRPTDWWGEQPDWGTVRIGPIP